jgi:hypothetical protein
VKSAALESAAQAQGKEAVARPVQRSQRRTHTLLQARQISPGSVRTHAFCKQDRSARQRAVYTLRQERAAQSAMQTSSPDPAYLRPLRQPQLLQQPRHQWNAATRRLSGTVECDRQGSVELLAEQREGSPDAKRPGWVHSHWQQEAKAVDTLAPTSSRWSDQL